MHLAFLSTHYYPRMRGGAEHSLQYHAETLVRLGARVSVLSLHDGDKVERFTHHGVECHAFPAPNLRQCLAPTHRASAASRAAWHLIDIYNLAARRLLERELRAIKPDLLQTENLPGWSCAAWDAIRCVGIPHIQMLHDFQLTCPAATRFRNGDNCRNTCFTCRPLATVTRRLSQRVRHVVANSNYTRDLYKRLGFFGNARSFDVIYGAVPPPVSRAESRREGPVRVGYLGRLHPTKGIRVLLDAFIHVDHPDLVLRIAGTGVADYEAELRAAARGHAVEFLGHAPAAEFLDTIDVLVVPSLWHEPMGRVVIEAATHGVPVIAATRGGISELFTEGETGWSFDPAEPEQLERHLRALRRDRLAQMREACRRSAAKFAPEPIAQTWLQLYSRVLRHDSFSSDTQENRSASASAHSLSPVK